jgi:prepilin-type N-terminal cleavage/methylation domain-containing protein
MCLTIIVAAQNLRDERSRRENPVSTERVSGFSLVEVMIAVAVFAIIILAIGQAAMVGIGASNEVEEQANALLGCQQVMEQCLHYSLSELALQDGSLFSVRVHGPDTPLEEGGVVVVDKDLNGDGIIQAPSVSPYQEGRAEGDIFRIALFYKKAEKSAAEIKKRENLVLQRVITLRR